MGTPAPVLLLHAAGRTPQMWQAQVEAIGAGTPVLAPWLAGLRPGKPAELSLSAAADEVLTTMDRNGISAARLVGHQLGAMVALQAAATEPSMVSGLMLSGAMVAPTPMSLRLQRTIIRLLPNKSLADSGATKADLVKALDLIATADFGSHLAEITAPSLIVAGDSDPSSSPARNLASALPNGRFVEISGAAGNPSLENPDEYNRLLVEFLTTEVG